MRIEPSTMERAEAEAIYEQGREAVVAALLALSAQIAALEARLAKQEERIAELERQPEAQLAQLLATAQRRSARGSAAQADTVFGA